MNPNDTAARLEAKRALAAQMPPPVWDGDLEDDCTSRWAGLLLRAELMDAGRWWWAVYDDDTEDQIDSSNEHDVVFPTGEKARAAAVVAARRYLGLEHKV